MSTVPQVEFNRSAVRPTECIKGAWNLIKDRYWLMLGMCLIAGMIAGAVPFGILLGPMMCGLFMTFFALRRGQFIEFGMLFKGFEHFAQSVIATLVHVVPLTVIVIGAYILFYVFFLFTLLAQGGRDPDPSAMVVMMGLYGVFWIAMIAVIMLLSIGFMFVYPLIVDRGMMGIDAIKLSFRAAFANFWGLLGLVFLNFLLSIAGLLMCIVGVYFVLPVTYSAIAVAYEQVFGLREGPLTPNTPPPPPVFT